jgi:hypothetical protein
MVGSDFWTDGNRQIYYSTNDATDGADEWGYELPLTSTDGDRACAFTSIAVPTPATTTMTTINPRRAW